MAVVKLNRAIKYRAYPTEGQAVLLAKTFGCVRFVWNHMLTDAQTFLDEAGVFFIPTPAKYKKEFPFLKEVDSLALANTQLDLKDANKRHLESPKTVGVPRLKSKHKSGMSYTTNNQKVQNKDGKIKNTVYVVGNLIHLPKVGDIKVKVHRQPGAGWILKGATVSCTRSGKYFISLLYEFEKNIQPVVPTKETSLGLDYSSHDFYVDSNGEVANYPRFYRQSEEKLAKEQRKLSRMKVGSHNYDEQLHKVQLLHAILPIYIYEHSGIALCTVPFSDIWDSACIGFAAANINDFMKQRISDTPVSRCEAMHRAEDCIRNELEAYSDYLAGNCWQYCITDENGNVVDSCSGFIGDDLEKNGILNYICDYIEK